MKAALLALLVLTSCQKQEVSKPVSEVRVIKAEPAAEVVEAKAPAIVSQATLTAGPSEETLFNVALAVSKINGLIVSPDEAFSFNKIVGERTQARGFKVATTLFEGVETKDLGGGVCQVSTALYIALMYGGYKVLERHPHSTPRSYAQMGMDSSINWPDLDMRFQNNDSRPVTIRATLEGTSLHVVLESLKEPPSVATWWLNAPAVQYDTRRVPSAQATHEYRIRKGKLGTPGFRVWDYKGLPQLEVRSEYKPVLEVMVVPLSQAATVP